MPFIGRTLGLYIARALGLTIIWTVLGTISLVFIIDFIELIRRSSDSATATLPGIIMLGLLRAPSVAEQALPFAVLFGAMIAFLNLSRKLELVVARASGVSVWQLLIPALAVGLGLGLFAAMAYNPLAAEFQERALALEASVMGGKGTPAMSGAKWLRQKSVDGQSIMRAQSSSNRGKTLINVTAFVFAPDGSFIERVEASAATLQEGHWNLNSARVMAPGRAAETPPTYLLATNLSAEQVAESTTPATAISFWRLPAVIERAELSGLPSAGLKLQYQALIARPALFITMILIAMTVSLRFFRLGGIARVILGGVTAGFMLYVMAKLAEDLGAGSFISPVLAAWTPALVASLMSITVLLYQEDG